jgi:hypothetical protein
MFEVTTPRPQGTLPPGFSFDVEGPIEHPERGPVIALRATGPGFWDRLVLPVSSRSKVSAAALLLSAKAWRFANRQTGPALAKPEGGR